MARTLQGLDDFERDAQAFIENIASHFIDAFGDRVVEAVITAAKVGIGPGDKKYPAYSQSYKKQLGLKGGHSATMSRRYLKTGAGGKRRVEKAQAAGNKVFLTATGTMLDPSNFSWATDKGGVTLVWTAPSDEVGVYAAVHNDGLPIGRGGPRKKREFMHFEARLTWAAVEKALDESISDLARQFNEGMTPR